MLVLFVPKFFMISCKSVRALYAVCVLMAILSAEFVQMMQVSNLKTDFEEEIKAAFKVQ
jgi:hypothetical protein